MSLLLPATYSFAQSYSGQSDTISVLRCYKTCDTIEICNIREITRHYTHWNFNLDTVRLLKEVPRLYVNSFPKELKNASYKDKKKVFIGTTLAAVLKANEEIGYERNEIECLSKKDTLSDYDSLFLSEIKRKYYAESFEEMLHKVDGLPPSLVIAQGINESGWGTSFFSIYANSIFGMKAPSKSSLPTIKHPVHSFVTYKFCSLEEGIKEYMLNINRHRLYKPLRDIRYAKRKNNILITGPALLKGMKRYSSRGQVYVNTIQKVITIYDLQEFDSCFLASGRSLYLSHIK